MGKGMQREAGGLVKWRYAYYFIVDYSTEK